MYFMSEPLPSSPLEGEVTNEGMGQELVFIIHCVLPQGTPPRGGAEGDSLLQYLLAANDVDAALHLPETLTGKIIDGLTIDH